MVGYWGLGGTIMFNFKSIVNAVINSNSTTVKVVGYAAIAAIGIGADIIGASAKKVEVVEAPAPATDEVHDEDIVTVVEAPASATDDDVVVEVIHDEDTVMEVVHDDDIVEEVIHDDEDIVIYDDSADREAEDELFEAAIKSTSNSFEAACEEVIELRKNGGNEEEAIETEKMAKLFLEYLQLNLGKEEECLVVHNAREALAAFRTFGPTRIEWM